jgi:hypothetical protein
VELHGASLRVTKWFAICRPISNGAERQLMLWQSCAFRKRVHDRQSVGRPILVTENPTTIHVSRNKIIGRVGSNVSRCAITDFKIHNVTIRSIYDLVRYAAGWKARAHAGP